MLTYHVLSNEVGTILAVYGSALLSEAQEKARVIERETGGYVIRHTVDVSDYKKRPRVGGVMNMKKLHLRGCNCQLHS